MPRGHRDARTASLEALFCILALLGVVTIGYATGRVFGVKSGRNEITAREHYDREKRNALRACSGSEGSTAVECVTKAIETAQEKSETRQDLYAQQDAARWGFWSVILAAVGTSFTALGVWYVKRTLDATLKAVEDTSKATVEIQKSNELSERLGTAQIRAYVIVSLPEGYFDEGGTFHGSIRIHNTGETAAKLVFIRFQATAIGMRIEPPNLIIENSQHHMLNRFTLMKGESREERFFIEAFPSDIMQLIGQRRMSYSIGFWFSYVDVFTTEQRETLCATLNVISEKDGAISFKSDDERMDMIRDPLK